jgi:hypothetical protein
VNTVLTGYEDNTTAIFLGANGEYTLVKDNNFMGTYSAIRGIGGANTIFEDNTIMSSPATFSGLRALVYFQAVPTTAGLNSGKVIIKGNRINHNAGGITAVYCSGDRNRNERRYTIDGNHILVHGDGAQSRCIYLFNADGSIVTNNYLIPTVTTLSAGTSGVIISDCVDVLIDNNTVQYGNGVVLQTGSKAVVGRTIMLNPVTNAVKNYVLDTSLLFTYSGIYNFRFNSAGTMSQSEVDVLSWTSVKNGTGDFTITHNLNTTNYVVTPIADNTSTPSLFTITRTANNFNIKCFNTSGVLTDPASGVMGMVKVSIRELTNI